MATTAQRSKARRDRKKALGLKKIEVYLVDNVEARADLVMYVDYLNKKFNMMKLG